MDKVYCKTCKHRKNVETSLVMSVDICMVSPVTIHTYLEPLKEYHKCGYTNEDNDCKLFESNKRRKRK